MLKIVKMYWGRLEKSVNKQKEIYYDWRSEYYKKDGIIVIYEDDMYKGKYIIRFFLVKENGEVDNEGGCLKTSFGDLFIDYVTGRVCLLTRNSTYYFDEVILNKEHEKSK